MMRCPAKLIGGRYDGDRGMLRVAKVPEFIWAFECPAGRDCIHNGGIHWTTREDEGQSHGSAELYAHTGFDGSHDEMPVAVYVVAPDSVPIDVLHERDLTHA
jgi:hypothetical protein